jgi:hypothetical protein
MLLLLDVCEKPGGGGGCEGLTNKLWRYQKIDAGEARVLKWRAEALGLIVEGSLSGTFELTPAGRQILSEQRATEPAL